MHDFSAIDMLIKTKLMFFLAKYLRKELLRHSPVLEKGREAAAHLHLKRHARKQHVSASTKNMHFQNYTINDLWGILN